MIILPPGFFALECEKPAPLKRSTFFFLTHPHFNINLQIQQDTRREGWPDFLK
jgi:hypothetical protein